MTQTLRHLQPVVLLSGLALAGADAAHAQAYTVTELPFDIAYGVNDAGEVVGAGLGAMGMRWDQGILFPIGTLGGSTYGDKINGAGDVVGASENGAGQRRAFVSSGGVMVDLGTLGGSSSDARGINELGHVVGASWTAGDVTWRAWEDTGAGMTMLPSFGGTYSGAEAINAAGTVVGWSDYSNPATRRAFRYQGGVLTDLGTLSGISVANDLNDAGWIVGSSENANGRNRPVYWVGNTLYTLGMPSGATSASVSAIDEEGRMVGTSSTPAETATVFHAWGAVDLNTLTGGSTLDLMRAEDVNDSGEIVGYALDTTTGTFTSFLARPNPLQLTAPLPGLAGMVNSFTITGANPGSTVRLVYGTRAGTTDLAQWCRGEQLAMRTPSVGAQAVANASGWAVPSALTPANGSGVTVRYQAVELDSCRVSNLIVYTYP